MLRSTTAQRRAQLETLGSQLAATRSAMFTSQLPTHLRYQSLTYSHVASMLLRDQRQKVGCRRGGRRRGGLWQQQQLLRRWPSSRQRRRPEPRMPPPPPASTWHHTTGGPTPHPLLLPCHHCHHCPATARCASCWRSSPCASARCTPRQARPSR